MDAVKQSWIGQPLRRFNLHGARAADFTETRELLRVGASCAADNDHELHLLGSGDGVLLASNRDRANCVDDLQLVAARNKEGRQALKLPWWLGGLGNQGHALATRNGGPVLLFVDEDGVGGKPKQPNNLRVIRGAEENDLVPLLYQPRKFTMLLRHPGAGAVDYFEPTLCCTTENLRGHPMRANHDGGPRSDLIKVVNILNTAGAEVGDQPLVVYDMPQGVGLFSRGAGDLGFINGLTDAIADAGALRDDNVLDILDICKARLLKLQTLLGDIQFKNSKQLIGKKTEILIENKTKTPGQFFGRSKFMHSIFFNSENCNPGDLVDIEITSCNSKNLFGILQKEEVLV